MKRRVIDAVLGLSVAICLAVATPARPATLKRIYNMANSTPGNKLYLSVYGGPQCQDRVCSLPRGRNVILWDGSSSDQLWTITTSSPRVPQYAPIQNSVGITYLSVFAGSTSDGANVIVWPAGNSPNLSDDQRWLVWPATSVGAPFLTCYVIKNAKSGEVLSVSNGDVRRGTQVVQWPLFVPQDKSRAENWHHDQFWCFD